jgi:hypothetical protein
LAPLPRRREALQELEAVKALELFPFELKVL